MAFTNRIHIGNLMSRTENDGFGDESVLITLDLADHARLFLDGVVVVDESDAAQKGQIDGHFRFGHGVHRR